METEKQEVDATQPEIRFITIPEHCSKRGSSPPTYYRHVKLGIDVPPINTGIGQSRIAEHESNAINAALLAGESLEKRRVLVKALIEIRPRLFGRLIEELQLQLDTEQAA
jgi:predicted DNA-binding transcriptional regulator AlpA